MLKTTFIAGLCLDPALALRVEGRGGLVQQEDGRVTDQGPGYGYPLLLTSCNEEIISHRYEHLSLYKLKYMLMKQDYVAFCRAINKKNPLTELYAEPRTNHARWSNKKRDIPRSWCKLRNKLYRDSALWRDNQSLK